MARRCNDREMARAAGARWFRDLAERDPGAAWALGDDLTLGCFDWRDWLDERPPVGFLAGVCAEAQRWEERCA